MLYAILLFLLGLWSITATGNALRPNRRLWLLFPSLVWSLVVSELPGQHVAVQAVLLIPLVWATNRVWRMSRRVAWLTFVRTILHILGIGIGIHLIPATAEISNMPQAVWRKFSVLRF